MIVCAWLLPVRSSARGHTERNQAVVRMALVIGNNASPPNSPGVPHLRYADDDALATHLLLRQAGVDSRLLASFDRDTRALHRDSTPLGPPTRAQVHRALGELRLSVDREKRQGRRVEFLFYFSGHGDVSEGEGFVSLEDDAFTRSDLHALLRSVGADRNHVIVDACRSYFLVFDRGTLERERYTGVAPPERVPADLQDTGFVLSTSSARDSHEWARYQGGILSHQLRSALRGAADTNGDAQVSYRELSAFLRVANQAIANPQLRPDFTVRPSQGSGDEAILSWRERQPDLSIPKSDLGHFYVETRQGVRLLDAHPALDQPLSLWLGQRRPLFVRLADESLEYSLTDGSPTSLAGLEPSAPALQQRGARDLALADLFKLPFSRRDVAASVLQSPSGNRGRRVAPEERERDAIRSAAGWAVLASGLTAAALGIRVALVATNARGKDQLRASEANRQLDTVRAPLLVASGLTAAFGSVWMWLPAERARLPLASTHGVARTGFLVGLRRAF